MAERKPPKYKVGEKIFLLTEISKQKKAFTVLTIFDEGPKKQYLYMVKCCRTGQLSLAKEKEIIPRNKTGSKIVK